MTSRELDRWIQKLAALEPTPAPLLSAYLQISAAEPPERAVARLLQALEPHRGNPAVLEVQLKVLEFLSGNPRTQGSGMALFCRTGDDPFFAVLSLPASLEEQISIGPVPHLYPLLALRNAHPSYLVVVAGARRGRVISIDLGRPTTDFRLPARLETAVTSMEHYMEQGAHAQLILYGERTAMAKLEEALPPYIHARLAGQVGGSAHDLATLIAARTRPVIQGRERNLNAAAIQSAIKNTPSLVVTGIPYVMGALGKGNVSQLFVQDPARPAVGRVGSGPPGPLASLQVSICSACGIHRPQSPDTSQCIKCGAPSLLTLSLADWLLASALRSGVKVRFRKEPAGSPPLACLLKQEQNLDFSSSQRQAA